MIRAAGPWDAAALARVHIRTWREAFTSLVPEQALRTHETDAHEAWERRLADPGQASYWVAERDGQMVGFSWARAMGPGHVRPLELVGLYVLAEHYGTGVADDLLTCAVGAAPCFCWVARDNPRAQAFYRRHLFVADGLSQVAHQWGDLALERMVR